MQCSISTLCSPVPRLGVHRRSRRSRNVTTNTTYIHSILSAGREAGGDFGPSRVTNCARDCSIRNGGDGSKRCARVLYRGRDGKLESRQETGGQMRHDWNEVLLSL